MDIQEKEDHLSVMEDELSEICAGINRVKRIGKKIGLSAGKMAVLDRAYDDLSSLVLE